MQRHARWIALAVVCAMAAPFLAQGLSSLLSVDPLYVGLVLLAVIVLIVVRMARPGEDRDEP